MSLPDIRDGYDQGQSILVDIGPGMTIDIFDPDFSGIEVEYIANSLANTCRYNGNVWWPDGRHAFLSVAEHSCHIHDEMKKDGHTGAKLAFALTHDATEWILGDQTIMIKRYTFIVRPGGREIVKFGVVEDRVYSALSEELFGVDISADPEVVSAVKTYDNRIIKNEWHFRSGADLRSNHILLKPLDIDPETMGWSPSRAKQEFFDRFTDLEILVG